MSHHHKTSAKDREATAPPFAAPQPFQAPGVLALILLATVLVYWPAMTGRFLWDDDANVTVPELQSPAGLYRIWFEFGATQQYYPLLHTAFWLENRLWGDSNPTAYHIISLCWHLISVVLVYAIVKQLKIPGALLAAALFAVHPVMVETVAWITEQKNTLSTMFYLGSLLAYLYFDESRQHASSVEPSPAVKAQGMGKRKDNVVPASTHGKRRWYLAALGLFVLALLAKSATVTLPAAIFVILWWQQGTLSWRRDVLPLVPFFIAAALMGLATCHVEWNHVGASGAEFQLTFVQRFLLAGRAIWFYLGKLFWPANLIFIYPRWQADPAQWWQWMFPLSVLVMTVGLWTIRKRSRAPLAAWLLFCGTLLPMLPFLNQYVFLYTFVCDHFMYLASLGMIVLVSGAIGLLLAHLSQLPRVLATGACLCLVAALAVKSRNQTGIYANANALFESTIDRNPECWMAYNNLGVFLNQNHKPETAVKYFRTSLQINPINAPAQANLGVAMAEQGNLPEAIEHFQAAVRIAPDFAAAHSNLGAALSKSGRFPEAINSFVTALSFAPEDVKILNNLGAALIDSNRYPEAINVLQRAAELRPDIAELRRNLGAALSGSGNIPKAIDQYNFAARLNPNDFEAHSKLAFLLSKSGNDEKAISHFEQAVRLKPNDADIQNRFGISLSKTGRTKQAVDHYQAALRADSNGPGIYANLAQALADLGRTNEALAAAQKGIAIARSTGKQAASEQIEEWLKDYQVELRRAAGNSSPPANQHEEPHAK